MELKSSTMAAFFMPTNDRKVNMSQAPKINKLVTLIKKVVWRGDGVQLSYVNTAVYQTKQSVLLGHNIDQMHPAEKFISHI